MFSVLLKIGSTHIDKAHIHNHIIFNSTSINCERKFKNFFFSNLAVRRISDLLCAEHGLSVIENPKPSKGGYSKRYDNEKDATHKAVLRRKIDEILPLCATFEDFLSKLKEGGCEVNTKRKKISVKAPDWGRPSRLDTLEGEYTEAAIRERLAGMRIVKTSGAGGGHVRVGLLVDIQAKIREGRGAGYEQWAKVFNLKQAAKTLIFLQENGIDSYEDLKIKSASASGEFSALTSKIKDAEMKLKEIAELQKYIGQYGKTRDVYAAYKASG